MPLRAWIDGKPVLAPSLSDAEWVELRASTRKRRESVKLPCCDANVGLRVSKSGLKHFYHVRRTPSGCRYAVESDQHLLLKWLICNACISAGWAASVEVSKADLMASSNVTDSWRADVLATKSDRQPVAFEVQVSALGAEDFQRRHEQYQADEVRCIWVTGPRAHPGATLMSPSFPAFALRDTENDGEPPSVRVSGKVMAIEDFVSAALDDRIVLCNEPSKLLPFLTLEFFVAECWRDRCGAGVGFFRSHATQRFSCGKEELLSGRSFRELKSVRNFYDVMRVKKECSALCLGDLKPRKSQGLGTELRFGCPKCDVLFGDHFLEPLFGEDPWEDAGSVAQARILLTQSEMLEIDRSFVTDPEEPHSHWIVRSPAEPPSSIHRS